jgi:hypothetical protein
LKDKVAALLNSWNIKHRIEHGEFVLRGSKLKVRIPSINENLAYLLGFLYGDGCLGKPQPRKKIGGVRFKVTICLPGSEKGTAQVQHICSIFKGLFNYEPRVRNRQRKGRKDWLEIEINSAVIYAYFFLLGFPSGEKYGKLKVPSVVATENLFRNFLWGLIDSDGYIAKDHRIIVVQKDRSFLDQVRDLCLRFLNVRFSIPRPNSKKVGNKIYTWYYIQTYKADDWESGIYKT